MESDVSAVPVPIVFVRVNMYRSGVEGGSQEPEEPGQQRPKARQNFSILNVLALIESTEEGLILGAVDVVQVVVAEPRLRVRIIQIGFASI